MVDISELPQQLVQRVDVVTGGASAAYGSDALSGVVNFVLDTEDKAKAQEDIGADIGAAQQEIQTALEPVTAAVSKLCPSS